MKVYIVTLEAVETNNSCCDLFLPIQGVFKTLDAANAYICKRTGHPEDSSPLDAWYSSEGSFDVEEWEVLDDPQ